MGASSAVVAIPNDAQGVRGRRLRLLATGTLYATIVRVIQ